MNVRVEEIGAVRYEPAELVVVRRDECECPLEDVLDEG